MNPWREESNEGIIISPETSLLDALNKMDQSEKKLLILCRGKKFAGVISIGDIQRAILKKTDLTLPVEHFVRPDIRVAHTGYDRKQIINEMLSLRMESMPVIDEASGDLVEIIEWDEVLQGKAKSQVLPEDCPVVIMAGGRGTRLAPITNVWPKPLLPISDKTVLEEIIQEFRNAGSSQFYLSLNYKASIIKTYVDGLELPGCDISYIEEDKPLGTGGALFLAREKLQHSFFVSNCDILLDIDFSELYRYHTESHNVATIVSIIKNVSIPYGTLETAEGGSLLALHEKPNFTYQINSGVYLLEPEIVQLIGKEERIDLPDVIARAMKRKMKVGVFPVNEGSWKDMGNWNAYFELIRNSKD